MVASSRRRAAPTAHAVPPAPLGRLTTTFGGAGIGAVAACRGVGGSVMTVPLLRRRGLPMADAAAMANPLSLPVAMVASIVYASPTASTPSPTSPYSSSFSSR
ncbi:TSUP family transporter [Embleya sp. NPDC055664]